MSPEFPLNRNDVLGNLWYGQLLLATGRTEKAKLLLGRSRSVRDLQYREFFWHQSFQQSDTVQQRVAALEELAAVQRQLDKYRQASSTLATARQLARENRQLNRGAAAGDGIPDTMKE